jgi:hypothetical protein
VPFLLRKMLGRRLKRFILMAGRELKATGLLTPLQERFFSANITNICYFVFSLPVGPWVNRDSGREPKIKRR